MPNASSQLSQSQTPSLPKRHRVLVERIRDCATELQTHTAQQLRQLSDSLRQQAQLNLQHSRTKRWSLVHRRRSESFHLQAFALIAEAVRRTLSKTYYDVQLMGGIELTQGRIVQMQTGEGKTLTTALPAFVHSLTGEGVHVATTNAYLARRDCEELRTAFELLGVRVGLLPDEHDDQQKRAAYSCDVTFGTGYEFGFDFLRDQLNLRNRPRLPLGLRHLTTLMGYRQYFAEPLQRQHVFCVIDEADSVLIDEATMPLILSTGSGIPARPEVYQLAHLVAEELREDADFTLHHTDRTIQLTDSGWQRVHEVLLDHPDLPLARHWSVYVRNALHARMLLQRDVDYVVLEGTIRIVDQHTGRIHSERTWRDGLHQAVECCEGVEITAETASDARITRQRYFQQYSRMAGMTGTAAGIEDELTRFYRLSTTVIPTHRPCLRETWPLRSFVESPARDAAIVREVLDLSQAGRPVLVGTRTIRHSKQLSQQLSEAGQSHTVLNGVQDEEEAQIVARAGQARSVTIATNMAGRGTDIQLPSESIRAGGLHVIGAEHNLSARVDRQLAGRAARQGHPGSCRFFAAADDELLAHDESVAERIRGNTDQNGECRNDCTDKLAAIQRRLELRQFQQRQSMVARDHWLDEVLRTLAGTA